MPNEFKVRNGLVVDSGGAIITGSLTVTGTINGAISGSIANALTASYVNPLSQNVVITGSSSNSLLVRGSGATSATNALRIENSSATAALTVRDDGLVSVMPNNANITIDGSTSSGGRIIIQSPSSNALIGINSYNTFLYPTELRIFSGTAIAGYINGLGDFRFYNGSTSKTYMYISTTGLIGINKGTVTPNAELDVSGSVIISGSLIVTGGITGSLLGTASYATQALSASWAPSIGTASPFTSSESSIYSTLPAAYINPGINNSLYIGEDAGYLGTLTLDSIFIGYHAGYNSPYAYNSVFLGSQAGKNSDNANNSVFIGSTAGMLSTNASSTIGIGNGAAYLSPYASDSVFLGNLAGYTATSASHAFFIGRQAGLDAYYASHSIFIGENAGQDAANASRCVVIGSNSGRNVSGSGISSNNIIIGNNISLPNNTQNSLNIGGVLFGSNLSSTFTGNVISGSVSNGRIGINVPNPSFTLDVSGSGNFTNNVVISGSLIVTGGITGSGAGGGSAFPFTGSAGITGSLTVNGPVIITGSGATSATNALVVNNSSNQYSLVARNDGTILTRALILATTDPNNPPFSRTGSIVAGNFITSGSDYSLVLGESVVARNKSIAVGGSLTSTIGSDYTLNIGESNTIYSSYGVSIGTLNNVGGTHSTAIGRQNTVSSSFATGYSTAIGLQNSAVGYISIALGESNNASGSRAITLGSTNTALGSLDIAIGSNNRITGGSSVALGHYLTSSIASQTIIGQYNRANSNAIFILGNGINISSRSNLIEASQNNIIVSGSLTISGSLTTNGVVSIGRGTTTNAVIQRAQTPAGAYSTILAAGTGISDTYPWTQADTDGASVEMRAGDPTSDQYSGGILITANGHTSPLGEGNAIIFKNRTGTGTYTERMRIAYDGNIGIGTSSPSERLHIVAAGNGTDVPIYVRGTGTKGGGGYLDFLKAENTGGGTAPKKFFRIDSNGTWEVINDAYSIVIMNLDDNGNMTIAGNLTQNSDISLKTNIQTIPNALEKTLQLRGVEYDRISTNQHEIGLIAQEVEQVFPELVSESNGIKSVAYQNIVGILIESIKELKQEINVLREQINKQ